jgi:hypothetical protein
MFLLGMDLPPCTGKEHGKDQSSCVRRLFSSFHKVGYMVWIRPRSVLVDGKISGRNESHISVSYHKVNRKKLRSASRAGS